MEHFFSFLKSEGGSSAVKDILFPQNSNNNNTGSKLPIRSTMLVDGGSFISAIMRDARQWLISLQGRKNIKMSDFSKKLKRKEDMSFFETLDNSLTPDSDFVGGDLFFYEEIITHVLLYLMDTLYLDLVFVIEAPRGIDGPVSERDHVWKNRDEDRDLVFGSLYAYVNELPGSSPRNEKKDIILPSMYISILINGVFKVNKKRSVRHDVSVCELAKVIHIDTTINEVLGKLMTQFNAEFLLTDNIEAILIPLSQMDVIHSNDDDKGTKVNRKIIMMDLVDIDDLINASFFERKEQDNNNINNNNNNALINGKERNEHYILNEQSNINEAVLKTQNTSPKHHHEQFTMKEICPYMICELLGLLLPTEENDNNNKGINYNTPIILIESLGKRFSSPLEALSVISGLCGNSITGMTYNINRNNAIRRAMCHFIPKCNRKTWDIKAAAQFLITLSNAAENNENPKNIYANDTIRYILRDAKMVKSMVTYRQNAEALQQYNNTDSYTNTNATGDKLFEWTARKRELIMKKFRRSSDKMISYVDMFSKCSDTGHPSSVYTPFSTLSLFLYDYSSNAEHYKEKTLMVHPSCLIPSGPNWETSRRVRLVLRALFTAQRESCGENASHRHTDLRGLVNPEVTWYKLYHTTLAKKKEFLDKLMRPKMFPSIASIFASVVLGGSVGDVCCQEDCTAGDSFMGIKLIMWLCHSVILIEEVPLLIAYYSLMSLYDTDRSVWEDVYKMIVAQAKMKDQNESSNNKNNNSSKTGSLHVTRRCLELQATINYCWETVAELVSVVGCQDVVDVPSLTSSCSVTFLQSLCVLFKDKFNTTDSFEGDPNRLDGNLEDVNATTFKKYKLKSTLEAFLCSTDRLLNGVTTSIETILNLTSWATEFIGTTLGEKFAEPKAVYSIVDKITSDTARFVGLLNRDEMADLLDEGNGSNIIDVVTIKKTANRPSGKEGIASPGGVILTDAPLPIMEHMENIMKTINNNTVTCIQGETGCGKSSMIPLHLYYDASNRGILNQVRIIVTQPRRIAAVKLAQRVASLLGEEVGESIGYRIGGGEEYHKESRKTRVFFVTTGYLLESLVSGGKFWSGVTHIVLDEVHERCLQADMVALVIKLSMASEKEERTGVPVKIIRSDDNKCRYNDDDDDDDDDEEDEEKQEDALPEYSGGKRVVIMSATIQAKMFKDYLSPLLTGWEDYANQRNKKTNRRNKKITQIPIKKPEIPTLKVGAHRCHVDEFFMDDWITNLLQTDKVPKDVINRAKSFAKSLSPKAPPQIAGDKLEVLINAILISICVKTSVLVFLPGLSEIEAVMERLKKSEPSTMAIRIIPLHSIIDFENQNSVDDPCNENECKVILATNIAETSLTIADIKVVIDTGMVRRIEFDKERNLRVLKTTWCSKSSVKQRSGRAGRVSDGVVYRLYTKSIYDHTMEDFDPSELFPLEHSVLQVRQHMEKFNDKSTIQEVMGMLIEPPSREDVDIALRQLVKWHALTKPKYDITPLGSVALALPIDIRQTRAILLGVSMGCAAEIIIIIAGLNLQRPVFQQPLSYFFENKNNELVKAVISLCDTIHHFDKGWHSDLHKYLNIFEELYPMRHKGRFNIPVDKGPYKMLALRQVNNFFKTCGHIAGTFLRLGLPLAPHDKAMLEVIGYEYTNLTRRNKMTENGRNSLKGGVTTVRIKALYCVRQAEMLQLALASHSDIIVACNVTRGDAMECFYKKLKDDLDIISDNEEEKEEENEGNNVKKTRVIKRSSALAALTSESSELKSISQCRTVLLEACNKNLLSYDAQISFSSEFTRALKVDILPPGTSLHITPVSRLLGAKGPVFAIMFDVDEVVTARNRLDPLNGKNISTSSAQPIIIKMNKRQKYDDDKFKGLLEGNADNNNNNNIINNNNRGVIDRNLNNNDHKQVGGVTKVLHSKPELIHWLSHAFNLLSSVTISKKVMLPTSCDRHTRQLEEGLPFEPPKLPFQYKNIIGIREDGSVEKRLNLSRFSVNAIPPIPYYYDNNNDNNNNNNNNNNNDKHMIGLGFGIQDARGRLTCNTFMHVDNGLRTGNYSLPFLASLASPLLIGDMIAINPDNNNINNNNNNNKSISDGIPLNLLIPKSENNNIYNNIREIRFEHEITKFTNNNKCTTETHIAGIFAVAIVQLLHFVSTSPRGYFDEKIRLRLLLEEALKITAVNSIRGSFNNNNNNNNNNGFKKIGVPVILEYISGTHLPNKSPCCIFNIDKLLVSIEIIITRKGDNSNENSQNDNNNNNNINNNNFFTNKKNAVKFVKRYFPNNINYLQKEFHNIREKIFTPTAITIMETPEKQTKKKSENKEKKKIIKSEDVVDQGEDDALESFFNLLNTVDINELVEAIEYKPKQRKTRYY